MRTLLSSLLVPVLVLAASGLAAQVDADKAGAVRKEASASKEPPAGKTAAPDASGEEASAKPSDEEAVSVEEGDGEKKESSFEECKDQADNDGDGAVDCEDEDCLIYAMCVESSAETALQETGALCSDGADNDGDGAVDCEDDSCAKERWCRQRTELSSRTEQGFACGDGIDNDADGLIDCAEPSCASSVYCEEGPELGLRCRDNKDNDGNGLVDCQEKTCHRTWYCRSRIYYVPETPGRPVGLMLGFSTGPAIGNWRENRAGVCIDENRDGDCDARVGYSQNIGMAFKLEAAYLPTDWFGFGIEVMFAASGATNQFRHDPDDYKYEAVQLTVHGGGFVRLQLPVWERFVPYLQVAGGYSYISYFWMIYGPQESWTDIHGGDYGQRATPRRRLGQGMIALEPGFDVYVRKRSIAVGLRAWLPMWGYEDASADVIGVMANLTYTPRWREKPRLKPEYENPQPKTDAQGALP